ncbi:hypothetical protein [Mycobacterium sp. URHB0021]
MVVSNAWNLVWILPVLVMVSRAVFCSREEPMDRIVALLSGLAKAAAAAATVVLAVVQIFP